VQPAPSLSQRPCTWARLRPRGARAPAAGLSAMGSYLGVGQAEDEEEQEEERLKKWRPVDEHQQLAALRRKKFSSKSSESSEEASGGGHSDEQSASSVGGQDSEESEGEKSENEGEEAKSQKSNDDATSSANSEEEAEKLALEKREDARRTKKWVVRMEFEPLLSLHEPLGTWLEEPADIWARGSHTRKHQRAEKAALEESIAAYRNKGKVVAQWLADMGLEDCSLTELAAALEEDPDELRYALTASRRFEVHDDGMVYKTVLQRILECMESDIETVNEVLERLIVHDVSEEQLKEAVADSLGELRLKVATDIELIEHVDIEAENRQQREDEKEQRLKEKEDKKKAKTKRGRKAQEQEEDEEEDSSEDEDGLKSVNKEAERKALAFRRLQVQRRVDDFLKTYTRGQNLQKINAKGKRYNRRVYVDTAKRALVVQGAGGPSFFPFVNMKEIDIDTHTSKEGRVETHVICAMEKGGRIYRELNLAFPDQAKANNFVNCVTLFSLALRNTHKS